MKKSKQAREVFQTVRDGINLGDEILDAAARFRKKLKVPTASVGSPLAELPWFVWLGVPEDASEERVKSAYRKLSQHYHPDAGSGDPQSTMFKIIDAAWQEFLRG